MPSKRRRSMGLAVVAGGLLALVVSACAAAPAPTRAPSDNMRQAGGAGVAEAPTEAVSGDTFAAAPPEAKSQLQFGEIAPTSVAPGQGDQNNPLIAALPQDRLIIKNGQISLLVQDARTGVDQVTQIAVDNGGYVLSSQAALDAFGVMNATLTIAVRADQYETAMRRLRQIALEVQQETSTGQDVTSEYVDLNSRLTNLEATRARIAALLDKANTVDEALAINQQLSDIEGQIEQVKGRMTYLSGRAAFSTITVNLNQKVNATPTPIPTATPTPTPTSPWSLDPTLNQATRTQISLLRGLLQLGVWLVVVLGPYAVVIGLVLWGLNTWVKRRKQRSTPPPETKE